MLGMKMAPKYASIVPDTPNRAAHAVLAELAPLETRSEHLVYAARGR